VVWELEAAAAGPLAGAFSLIVVGRGMRAI
jgi:hypothetical protein